MSFSLPVFDSRGNQIRRPGLPANRLLRVLDVLQVEPPPSPHPQPEAASTNSNRHTPGYPSDPTSASTQPAPTSDPAVSSDNTGGGESLSRVPSINSEASLHPAEPVATDNDYYYDVDRQLLLPANMQNLVPQPDTAVDMHYPTFMALTAATIGIILGVYEHRQSSGALTSMLGYTTFICFITKPFFQGLLNTARRSTYGLSTGAHSLYLLSHVCLMILVFLDYFGVGFDGQDPNLDDDGGLLTQNIFLVGPLPIIYATFAVVQTFLLTEQCAKLNPEPQMRPHFTLKIATYGAYVGLAVTLLMLAVINSWWTAERINGLKAALLVGVFVPQLCGALMQAKLNLDLQRFVGQDLASVYLDTLGNVCLFVFIIATGIEDYNAQSSSDSSDNSEHSAFSAGCVALLQQPLVSLYAFFLGLMDTVFIMEFFLLLDGDLLDPGDETCIQACCQSTAIRRRRRRNRPQTAPATMAPSLFERLYRDINRNRPNWHDECVVSQATVDLDVTDLAGTGTGAGGVGAYIMVNEETESKEGEDSEDLESDGRMPLLPTSESGRHSHNHNRGHGSRARPRAQSLSLVSRLQVAIGLGMGMGNSDSGQSQPEGDNINVSRSYGHSYSSDRRLYMAYSPVNTSAVTAQAGSLNPNRHVDDAGQVHMQPEPRQRANEQQVSLNSESSSSQTGAT